VIEHATNEKIFNYAALHKDTMIQEYDILKHHKEQYPKRYQQWRYPAAWTRGINIEQHVDVPMHLFFLGVIKTTIRRIMDKHNNFLRMSTGVLESVARLHIDWCVAIPMNGIKFGGWVSENYLALARLCRWYFSMLPYLRSGPEYKDPERPCTTWSVKELRDWLRVSGHPCHGKKSELMGKVQHFLSSDEVPLQQSITQEVILQTKYYIKRFLSSYHDVDQKLLKEGDKPGWLLSYNFMSLLNIPQLMECYGPMGNLWEGGYNGERLSQELKHRLRGGPTDDRFMAIVKSPESGNSTAAVDEEEVLLSGDRGTANISGMTLLWGMTEVSSGNTSTRHSNGELDD